MSEILLPQDYRYRNRPGPYDSSGQLFDLRTNESFLLSNRSLRSINHTFAGRLISAISTKLATQPGDDVLTVLDIGAGVKRKAADQLQSRRRYRQRLNVIGLDVALEPTEGSSQRITADMLQLPIKDDSVDVAYSRQSLVYLAEGKPEVMAQCLAEIGRVLSPGGTALVDIEFYPGSSEERALEEQMPPNVSIDSDRLGLFGLTARLKRLESTLLRTEPLHPQATNFLIMHKAV